MTAYTDILVATLGGQPQIVTFTLDLLLQHGFDIKEVIVLHPDPGSNPRLQQSLLRLYQEFVGDSYRPQAQGEPRRCHFRSHVLHLDDQPLPDIIDEVSVNATRNTIHRLIGELKLQQRTIHLSISGGRRLMSQIAASIAIFNFDYQDHIWHIFTPEKLQQAARDGKIMHVPAEAGIRLLAEPFVPLGAYIATHEPTYTGQQREFDRAITAEEKSRCDRVYDNLTPRQRAVLKAFTQGLKPQEVAQQLCITIKTVDSHKTVILAECSNVWGKAHGSLTYDFIPKAFARYF